jgi:hypothetical protein
MNSSYKGFAQQGTCALVKQDVGRRFVAGTLARDFALHDGVVVEVVPGAGRQVARVRRVVAAADGPEVADAAVQVEDGPGVDVMITIFCDFQQLSAKKLAFFSKTNVMIKFLNNLALFCVKNAIFSSKVFLKS